MNATKVTWVDRAGSLIWADVPTGMTLLQAALANNPPDILRECCGSLPCGTGQLVTQHTSVELDPSGVMEREFLEHAQFAARPNSGLTCRIIAEERLVVRI